MKGANKNGSDRVLTTMLQSHRDEVGCCVKQVEDAEHIPPCPRPAISEESERASQRERERESVRNPLHCSSSSSRISGTHDKGTMSPPVLSVTPPPPPIFPSCFVLSSVTLLSLLLICEPLRIQDAMKSDSESDAGAPKREVRILTI